MTYLFVLHPTNRAVAAGLAPYRSRMRARLWLCGLQFLLAAPIIACVLFVLMPMSLRDAEDIQKLQASGRKAAGVVEDLWEDRERKDRPVYRLRYRYTASQPDGEPGSFTGTESIPPSLYRQFKPGSPVEVYYLSERPQVARLSSTLPPPAPSGQNPLLSNAVFTVAALGCCIVPLLILSRAWPSFRREWRLERRGRLLTGEVVSFNPCALRFGREHFHLRYRFFTPEGRPVEAEMWDRANQLFGQNPPPGTPVAIWYSDPQHYTVL